MEKEYVVNIGYLMALCYIVDDFLEFEKRLRTALNMKDNRGFIFELGDISVAKFYIGAKKEKKFYHENKLVIDKINQYSYITNFIIDNYDKQGNPTSSNNLHFFYEYIMKNKSEMDKIISLLRGLKLLGFSEFIFHEKMDFTSDVYSLDKRLNENLEFAYLDQMEVIPHYDVFMVEYRTSGSNYKISIDVGNRDYISSRGVHKIILNDLTFDVSRLPDTLLDTFDKIIELSKMKKLEYLSIRNSVELSSNISDLYWLVDVVNNKINDLDNIEKKGELIELLSIIKESILKMQAISYEYDEHIVNMNIGISEKNLEEEKEVYVKKKNF